MPDNSRLGQRGGDVCPLVEQRPGDQRARRTSLFVDGRLVSNTELGHIEVRGKVAEHRASDSARKREDLSWEKYAKLLDEYLHRIEDLLWPDLIVVGEGISKKSDKFSPTLRLARRSSRRRC
jgi:polyphosphate glucokinase